MHNSKLLQVVQPVGYLFDYPQHTQIIQAILIEVVQILERSFPH